MLDETLLDAPDALTGADTHGLLRGAAASGARVRTALRHATEAGLTELRPDGRPRAVLVAGTGPAVPCAADLIGAFGNGAVPVTLIHPTGSLADPGALHWTLPGWAGPLDLLLLATPDGHEGGLALLAEQAYRRGCTVVSVSPVPAPLAEATIQARGLAVPFAGIPGERYEGPDPRDAYERPGEAPQAAPGTLWALLTPLLVLTDRLDLATAGPDALDALADRLDRTAERCGPAVPTYGNPAKTLAAELSDALPLLWSEGTVAAAVARHCATVLAALAGRPALTARLPEAMTLHRALLAGSFSGTDDTEDFFRDRVEEPEPLHARVVLLREGAPAADSAAVAARDLAYAHGAPISELEPAEGSLPLEAAAELLATVDFAAVYLGLAGGGRR
ncbi:mannose-6-phosphate isomerase [Streptomyces sp. TRM43335]|uniref:Mannose-6-phosphate isomerase n=1 Tax=Streptomyces taklimakanensis TaxID=2569853 RepID=A0A6G2BAP4_9ACTN|nr:SIS domain-containing protein [Streptomyces taklimakanensis]MTE19294.1 mannose-6-phosphate isomerase [Streptomyces taklimakanensis]